MVQRKLGWGRGKRTGAAPQVRGLGVPDPVAGVLEPDRRVAFEVERPRHSADLFLTALAVGVDRNLHAGSRDRGEHLGQFVIGEAEDSPGAGLEGHAVAVGVVHRGVVGPVAAVGEELDAADVVPTRSNAEPRLAPLQCPSEVHRRRDHQEHVVPRTDAALVDEVEQHLRRFERVRQLADRRDALRGEHPAEPGLQRTTHGRGVRFRQWHDAFEVVQSPVRLPVRAHLHRAGTQPAVFDADVVLDADDLQRPGVEDREMTGAEGDRDRGADAIEILTGGVPPVAPPLIEHQQAARRPASHSRRPRRCGHAVAAACRRSSRRC